MLGGINMAKISTSILSSDFSKLGEEIKKVEKGGADYIHLDVMDGVFVPNITFGPPVIKNIRNITDIPFDVHLMIDRPERYIEEFAKAGSDIITVHEESTTHLHRTIQSIKGYGKKAGVSLNPSTPIENIEYVLEDLDMVLIMTVNPGFGGQSFIPAMERKIKHLRKIIDDRKLDVKIEVDGGIKLNNAREVMDYGVDILVIGSDIFKADDITKRVKMFKDI